MTWLKDAAPRWRRELPQALGLGVAYFVAAYLAIRYTRLEGGVALLWIATPVLAVDLRYRPERSWALRLLCCSVASTIATSTVGLGPGVAAPIALISMFEGAAIAGLMRRFVPVPSHLASARELGVLIVVAGLVVPGLTALPASVLAHWAIGVPIVDNALGWYAAHALGTLTVIPILKLAVGGDLSGWARKSSKGEILEAVGLTGAMIAVTLAVFTQNRFPLLFLPFLPMMMTVLRFGRLGAAVSLLVLTAIGTICTVQGRGPVILPQSAVGTKLLLFQLYLMVAALMALPAATELKRRKLLFSRLQETAALHKIIMDRSGDIIMAVDPDGAIRFASPSVSSIAGYTPEAIAGRHAQEMVFAGDMEIVARAHGQAMACPDRTVMFEFRAPRASGELAWFESHAHAITDDHGAVTGTVNVLREVSRRKARELDLARAATTDPLTGLGNRRVFAECHERLVASGDLHRSTAFLALFDLDHFKAVNDRFGHAVGDEVLKAFATILRTNLGPDHVVARLGGEEFGVIFTNVTRDEAMSASEDIRAELAAGELEGMADLGVRATVSVGLAVVDPLTRLEDALKAADTALYRAKANGRNRLAMAA